MLAATRMDQNGHTTGRKRTMLALVCEKDTIPRRAKNDFKSIGIPGGRPRTMLALYFTGVHCVGSGFSSRWRKRLRGPEWTLQTGLERPFWFELLPHGSCQPKTNMDTEENWKSTMLAFTYENIPPLRYAKIIFPSEIRKSHLRGWTMLALIYQKRIGYPSRGVTHLCISLVNIQI